MITRRDFIISSAAAAATAMPFANQAQPLAVGPLTAKQRMRRLFLTRTPEWEYRLVSDGPDRPQPLIKRSVVERTFGGGTYDTLRQRDHWEMIEAGWFRGDDLFVPQPVRDPEYDIWQAFYRPEVEAHDLLEDLFFEGRAPRWGAHMPEYSMTLAEHPNTPRYATAKIYDIHYLPQLAAAVEARTPNLLVEYGHFLERPFGADCA